MAENTAAKKGKNMLEVQHVSKVFKIGSLLSRKKLTAVDDVSFSISAEKPVILSIVGESGCGKSTLAKMILRLLDIDKGNVMLDGHNYAERANAPEIWRRKFLAHTIGLACIVLGAIIALVGAYGMYHLNVIANRYGVGFTAALPAVREYAHDSVSGEPSYLQIRKASEDLPRTPEGRRLTPETDLAYFNEQLQARGLMGLVEDYLIHERIADIKGDADYVAGTPISVSQRQVRIISRMVLVGTNIVLVGLIMFGLGIILILLGSIKSYPFRSFRHDVQPIFQNPFDAFSSRKTVDSYLFNTARRLGIAKNREDAAKRVDEALRSVGLSLDVVKGKYSNQFSGGELQRVSIARALITKPKVIIADEPVAMIDASMKMNIVNLFKDLRDNFGISFIYITHDLSTAYYVSDYIATLYRGCLIEYGTSRDIMDNPAHPYTKLLMDSVPRVGDKWEQDVAMPDMEEKEYSVTHCKFAARCPYVTNECVTMRPEMVDLGNEREVLCFHPLTEHAS
jgi:oligopeptide/dipeptide ABC transporter ATP-binding protein